VWERGGGEGTLVILRRCQMANTTMIMRMNRVQMAMAAITPTLRPLSWVSLVWIAAAGVGATVVASQTRSEYLVGGVISIDPGWHWVVSLHVTSRTAVAGCEIYSSR